MSYWSLQPIFSYPAVLIAGVALLALTLPRPTHGNLTFARRAVLIALRILAVALLIVAMLRPTYVSTTKKRQTAVLLLLMDQSRSMLLPDAREGKSRWAAQREALLNAQPQLKELAEDIEIKAYAYDQQPHALGAEGGELELPDEPVGRQTDIGTSLFQAVRAEVGKRLAGVILMGDGTQTAFDPQVEIRKAAREIARLDYPLYTVTFGPAGDLQQSRDLALENLQDQYTVFVKNELVIRAAVRVGGYVNQSLPVTLTVEAADGSKETLDPVFVTAREDGVQLPVEVAYTPSRPGRYRLTMRVQQQPGELIAQNNHLTAYLNVLEGGIKVLYLFGDRLGEQSVLRESVNASPDIELEHVFVDARFRDRWPANLGDTLTRPRFDVLLIEDLDSTALGEANIEAIAAAVEKGTGLMMLGGFQSFGAGGYQQTALADVLPIEMDRLARQEIGPDEKIRRDLHIWGKVPMLPTQHPHAITRLAPPDRNREFWRQLPPLNGANLFQGVKPRGTVLAETPNGVPLLVAGEYGAGRVLAMAGNSTARWWRHGHENEHKRFWRQVILWLVHRDDLEEHDVWIKLEQRRFHPGSRVVFTAGARNPAGDELEDAEYEVTVTGPDGRSSPLVVSHDKNQIVGAVQQVQQPGDYAVDVVVSQQGKPVGKARGEFVVFDHDIELSNPSADHLQMSRMAEMTAHAGGRTVAAEELSSLLEEIRRRPPEMEFEIPIKWQLGDTAWDAWTFFLVVVGLFSVEWTLRKKWGLV